MDIGNLSLPINIPGLAMLDRLEAQMGRLNQLERPINIGADTSGAMQALTALREAQTQVAQSTVGLREAQTALAQSTAALRSEQATQTQAMGQARTATEQYRTATAAARLEGVQFANSQRQMQAELRATSQQAKESQGAFGNLTSMFVQGVGAAIGFQAAKGIGAVADAALGMNSRLEQSALSFQVLTGSAASASTILTQLQTVASHSTFGLSQLQSGAQQLLAFGTAAKDVVPLVQAISTAAAASGGDIQDKFSRITYVLAELSSGMKLSERQIRELAMAGVPLKDLAASIGVSVTALNEAGKTGEVTSAQVVAGFQRMYSQGKFGDFMAQQASTASGAFSIFKTNATLAIAQGLHPLFNEFRDLALQAAQYSQSTQFHDQMARVSVIAIDVAHDLHEVVIVGEDLIGLFARIPTPVIETALRLGEAAIAVKALTFGYGLARAALAPMTALFAEQTAATIADTAALSENTAAVIANDVARTQGGAGGVAASGAGSALGKAGFVGSLFYGGFQAAQYGANRGFNSFRGIPVVGDLDELAMRTGLIGKGSIASDLGPQTGQRIGNEPSGGGLSSTFGNIVGQASEAAIPQLSQLITQVKTGQMTADQARGSFNLLAAQFGRFVPDIDAVRQAFEAQLNPAIVDHAKALNEAASAAEDYRAKLFDIGKAQAQGANGEDISRGILGITGEGQQATQSQVALAKQHIQELATAWTQAGSAINSVDISRGGIAGLAAQADGLAKARTELGRLGQQNASLNLISGIATAFKQVTDAEDKATAAMRGFDLTLSVTKGYMSDISGLKSDFIAALDAAEQRKAAGIADQSDLDLISGAAGSLSKLNDQYGKLQQHSNTDLIGKINNLPDYAALDAYTRNIVDRLGGGKQIAMDITVGKNDAQKAIDDIVNGHHEATIDLNLALAAGKAVGLPAWVLSALGIAGGGNPASGPAPAPTGGAAIPAASNPVGWNQFQPLAQSQFSSIANEGARGGSSPWADDPNMYAAVLAAAQKYGVDPRVLLAWTKEESGNGTTSSAALNAINNFGGIQFRNQPGATDAGFAEPPGPNGPHGNFAAFNTPQDFFNALAANLSTDNYRSLYDKGDLIGVSQKYAESPGTRVADYADYASRYPAGAGGASWDDPRFSKALGGTSAGSGQSIVNAAMLDEGAKAFVEQCEKWVEEKVQAATGQRGATGVNEGSAAIALGHAQSMGLETNVPKPGDLVYYAASANSPDGHVAIFVGSGQQISTEDAGGVAIHQEAVGAGAHYIMSPGVHDGSIDDRLAKGQATPDIGAATAPSALDSKTNVFFGRLAQAMTAQAIQPFASAVRQAFAVSSPADVSASIGMFNSVLPMLDKRAQATGGPGGTPTLTQPEKDDASNRALQQGLGFLAAWSTALTDIRDKTGNLAADQQKITDLLGGPMAQYLNAELAAMQSQAQIADRITQLTQHKTDLEASHTALLAQRQQADTTESRNQTRQGWADQDADTKLANRQRAENAAYTTTQRGFEDRQRALAFSQQLAATDLQNRLTDLQKTQQSTVYQRTSQEQLVAAQAAGASTNQGQGILSARLAAMHEQDTAQKDLNTKAIDDIQLQIREQAKQSNLESYNLQTETIAAQRKHEDILTGIDAEGVANTANRQARDRAHQVDLWQIEDIRTREDNKYNLAQTSLDKEIAAQQAMGVQADANLKAAQDALTIWQQTGVDVGAVGTAFSGVVQAAITAAQQAGYYASVAGLATANGVPYSQFPAPGGSDAARATPPVAPAAPANGGSGNTFNFGDLIAGSDGVSEERIDEITKQFNAALRQAVRDMRQAGRKQKAATGG